MPISWLSLLLALTLNQGPFPPPALPGFPGTTDPSATSSGPACPSRESGWGSRAPTRRGFPCCVQSPFACMPAPLPRWDPRLMSLIFARNSGLPRYTDGSAPTSPFSRPARRSLTFRPACSPSRPRRPSTPKASVVSSPPLPLRLLPAGATSCRVGLAPTEEWRLRTAHRIMRADME